MEENYTAAELKTVGSAEQVVLGSAAVGNDIVNEILIVNFEFEAD